MRNIPLSDTARKINMLEYIRVSVIKKQNEIKFETPIDGVSGLISEGINTTFAITENGKVDANELEFSTVEKMYSEVVK
jgi:hypothetical protein